MLVVDEEEVGAFDDEASRFMKALDVLVPARWSSYDPGEGIPLARPAGTDQDLLGFVVPNSMRNVDVSCRVDVGAAPLASTDDEHENDLVEAT